jgi:hypothetical protein
MFRKIFRALRPTLMTTAEIQEQIKAFDSETFTLETNLPKHWAAADTAQKQELQRALFPMG